MFTFKKSIFSALALTTLLSSTGAFAGYIDRFEDERPAQKRSAQKDSANLPEEDVQYALIMAQEILDVDAEQAQIQANAIAANIPLVIQSN